MQQISELMQADGVDIVGPLPDELQSITVFSAGVFTASAQPISRKAFVAASRLAGACGADPPQRHGAGVAIMLAPIRISAASRPANSCSACSLLWLAGIGLRITILAVPPVIPLIRTDLGMSETQVGILTGLPPVLFACTAVLGSLLIARFGALDDADRRTVRDGGGLGAARRRAGHPRCSMRATIVTGFGVAIMHPSLPPLVRSWLPHRIGFGTAVFTNGLLVGEILPVALTIPVRAAAASATAGARASWSGRVPVALIALVIWLLAPRAAAPRRSKRAAALVAGLERPADLAARHRARQRQRDVFHRQRVPARLSASHRPRRTCVSAALTALNVGQIPASFLLLAVAGRLERAIWPHVVCGAGSLAAIIGIAVLPGPGIVACAAVLGFFAAAILILMLALPPLLAPPDDVHRVSAAMFTISYSCAVITPVFSGLALGPDRASRGRPSCRSASARSC